MFCNYILHSCFVCVTIWITAFCKQQEEYVLSLYQVKKRKYKEGFIACRTGIKMISFQLCFTSLRFPWVLDFQLLGHNIKYFHVTQTDLVRSLMTVEIKFNNQEYCYMLEICWIHLLFCPSLFSIKEMSVKGLIYSGLSITKRKIFM